MKFPRSFVGAFLALFVFSTLAPALALTPSSLFPGGGGGSLAYTTGAEVYHDLSGGSYTATAADLNQVHVLYSSVEGQTFKLPPSNSGVVKGQSIGFRVLPQSKPIKIINAGTAGTDSILESYNLPKSDEACFANSIATAAGDWRCSGQGLFNGPVPVALPFSPDPGVDFGSVITAPNFGSSLERNSAITRLSSTLYVVCGIPNAGTSVVCYADSYNHATDAWTWGTPVTAFSSANTWQITGVVGLSSTTFAVMAWEATAAKQSARASTVSGTTITQGTTIQSAAGWGANPSSANSSVYSQLIADSATTFFYASRYDGTHLGITHFSVSGTTLTVDGGGAFGSSAMVAQYPFMCSTAANTIDTAVASDGAAYGVSRYTYSAGSVTNTFNRRDKAAFGVNTNVALHCVDTTNHIYFATNAVNNEVNRYILNGGATDLNSSEYFFSPEYAYGAGSLTPADHQLLFLTENEGLVIAGNGFPTLTLFDPTITVRTRMQENGVSAMAEPTTHFSRSPFPYLYGTIQGADVNTANRRFALFEVYQSQSLAKGRALAMQMYDLPRNYDSATQ